MAEPADEPADARIAATELDPDTVFGELTDELQQVIDSALRRDLQQGSKQTTTTNDFEVCLPQHQRPRLQRRDGKSGPERQEALSTSTRSSTGRWR